MTQAAVWLPERKDLMGEVASLCGGITGSRRRRLWYLHYFVWQIKNGVKVLYIHNMFAIDLPKACHSILHSPATSIKEKKHLAVTSPLLTPIILCLAFISPRPPIISLFQICNLLFIFFLCLAGRASVHLIKMYIFKSFFKGELFA